MLSKMSKMIRTIQLMLSFYTSSIALSSGYGGVRLRGTTNGSGTLEFYMTGDSWATVCLDGFDDAAATVVCRQLGYDHASYYSIGMDRTYKVCQVLCTGHEKWIQNCRTVWRLHQCSNCLTNDIVGINCTMTQEANTKQSNCTNDSNYGSGGTAMPGIIAGAVGGVAAILILAAFIIGYLTYNCYTRAVYRSNGREFHNDDSHDAASKLEPPPYQLPMSIDRISTHSIPKITLSDPPPNYSSLA